MSTQVAASYLPDSQVITLKPEFAAFDDPANLRGIEGPDQIGFFFHEWIHYLHNVSTIQGLSAFANLVHLWSAFRNTIGADGLCAGSAVLNEGLALNVRQKIDFMNAARGRRQRPLLGALQLQEIEFVSVSERTDPIKGTALFFGTITCQIAVPHRNGSKDLHVIEVGMHEIIESAAFMLEERLAFKLGSVAKVPDVVPYLLVRGIASHVVRGISDDCVVLCALASLQASDPPSVLLEILHTVRSVMGRGVDPLQFLREKQGKVLIESQEWVESMLQEVENTFPNDEPMARAVRSTTSTIRQNFVHRRASPFLEIGLVDEIAANPYALTEIVKTYGACAVIQQRHGSPHDIDRDLMYDFMLTLNHDDELSFGWRMMHAAFRFVALHCTKDVLLATEELQEGSRTGCPFYTACSYRFRRERPDDCATKPWLAARTNVNELCWYGRAVYALRPPSIGAAGVGFGSV